MQQDDKDDVLMRLDRLFGRGWRSMYANALGVRPATITDMKGSTLKFTRALVEFFEITSERRWPDRFSELAALRRKKALADKGKEQTHDTG